MALDKLQYSQGNAASTTLSSGVANSDTSAPLTSDTAFAAKSGEGMVVINEGTANEELAYATGKSGGALTIPADNRGLEGGSAQTHASGASVKGILTAGMWNNVIDALALLIDKTTGAIKSGISFTSPKIVTGINDTNGNELIKVTATTSAVNELTLANAATGNKPVLSATGDDTNIGIEITPKGTGALTVGGNPIQHGAWTSYTPSLTNVTVGNGTLTAAYAQIGKTIFCRVRFVLGSTSSVSGSIAIALPVTAASGMVEHSFACRFLDEGVNSYQGIGYFANTTTVYLFALNTASTYASWAAANATVPFTWGSTDAFQINFVYEAA